MTNEDRVRENLGAVRERITAAAKAAGRDAEAIRLVAVTKYVDVELMAAVIAAGQLDIGENRVPDALRKAAALPAELNAAATFHMIGHLQRNKARKAASLFSVLHSLDSDELAERLAKRAGEEPDAPGCREVFIETNTGGEAQKNGVAPDEVPAMLRTLEAHEDAGLLRPVGLMVIPPRGAPEETRPHFITLRKLAERVNAERGDRGRAPLARLSMGMSADFEVAIAEGATDVRVGSALYEGIR